LLFIPGLGTGNGGVGEKWQPLWAKQGSDLHWVPLCCWWATLSWGLSGTGLTFTRSQEGETAGWLTQAGQRNGVFGTIGYHAGFWLGELARGKLIAVQECTRHWAVTELPCVFPCFVCSFYQYY